MRSPFPPLLGGWGLAFIRVVSAVSLSKFIEQSQLVKEHLKYILFRAFFPVFLLWCWQTDHSLHSLKSPADIPSSRSVCLHLVDRFYRIPLRHPGLSSQVAEHWTWHCTSQTNKPTVIDRAVKITQSSSTLCQAEATWCLQCLQRPDQGLALSPCPCPPLSPCPPPAALQGGGLYIGALRAAFQLCTWRKDCTRHTQCNRDVITAMKIFARPTLDRCMFV